MPPFFHLTCPTPPKCNLYLANFLAAAVIQPAPYRLLTFQVPNVISLLHCLVRTKICPVQSLSLLLFCNKIHFDVENFLAPRPTPKLVYYPLSAVRNCFFNIFAATLHTGGQFLHPQREDAACRGDRDPQITEWAIIPVFKITIIDVTAWAIISVDKITIIDFTAWAIIYVDNITVIDVTEWAIIPVDNLSIIDCQRMRSHTCINF